VVVLVVRAWARVTLKVASRNTIQEIKKSLSYLCPHLYSDLDYVVIATLLYNISMGSHSGFLCTWPAQNWDMLWHVVFPYV
jgi:hypothetical protein